MNFKCSIQEVDFYRLIFATKTQNSKYILYEKFLVCQNFTCDISLNFLNFHIEVHLLRQIYFTIIRYKIISNNNIKKLLAILKKVFDINFFQESQKQLRKCLKKSSKFVKIEKVKFKASFVDRNGRTELSI